MALTRSARRRLRNAAPRPWIDRLTSVLVVLLVLAALALAGVAIHGR